MSKSRVFLSIYFSDGITDRRKKRDLTLSFNDDNELYKVCKALGSAEIKKLIKIDSYGELVNKAEAEGRPLGNFIKHALWNALKNEKKNTIS